MNVWSRFHDPLGLKNLLKHNGMISKILYARERVSKQTGFLQSQVWFWISTVFNKGDILSMCQERGWWRKDSSEWRRIIEMHLESKLIFSVGQRTGYGNKKRDVIRFSGV